MKLLFLLFFPLLALARPSAYTELLAYTTQAPDQGETNTCLFVASTGAMEIILNKKHKIKNPKPLGRFDLSERFLIAQDWWSSNDYWHVNALFKFNFQEAVLQKDLPFNAWRGDRINWDVWSYPKNFPDLPRIKVPRLETETLFVKGRKYATYVLDEDDVEAVKLALWNQKNPVLVNYNDEGYWHVVLIVGYDDNLKGDCYDTEPKECRGKESFYVRDSFGKKLDIRDTDWFRVKGNAAFVVRERKPPQSNR